MVSIIRALAAAFFAILLTCTISSRAFAAQEVMVIGNTVNLRSGPGITYDIVGQAHNGEKLAFLEAQAGWYKIKSNGKTAWMASWLGTTYRRTSDEKQPARSPEIFAFYEAGWEEKNTANYGFTSLSANYKSFSTLMPYWYTLNSDGSIYEKNYLKDQAVDFIVQHPSIKVMPMINNSQDGNFERLLLSSTVREKAIKNIVKMVMDHDYAGVTIDFELLPSETRDGLSAFIERLSEELKSKNKLIAVSVFPQVGPGLEELSAAYNYQKLGDYADFVTVMTYDRHSSSSGPGSVAPLDWVKDNLNKALQSIPRSKLILGIASYGYDWSKNGVEYISEKEAMARAYASGAEIHWDDQTQSPYYYYWIDSIKHEVWFENGYSVSQKAKLARDSEICGVSIWRIGFEAKDYWTQLNKGLGK